MIDNIFKGELLRVFNVMLLYSFIILFKLNNCDFLFKRK